MRMVPGSAIRDKSARATQRRPKSGTKIGDVYDRLRRGESISANEIRLYGERLRDDWGLEFAGRRGVSGSTRLIGEWDGPYFVPLERILQDEAADA